MPRYSPTDLAQFEQIKDEQRKLILDKTDNYDNNASDLSKGLKGILSGIKKRGQRA